MMESSNFRVGTGASFSRNNQLAFANLSQTLARPNRDGTIGKSQRFKSLPRAIDRHRDRWVDANRSAIGLPKSTPFSPQQWLLAGNPRLAKLVSETIGNRWMTHVEDLEQLVPIADCPLFQSQWQAVKLANKQALARELQQSQGIDIDINTLFDLHLQPIGAHHRQILNILHIINLSDRLKHYPGSKMVPRTFIFGDLDADAVLAADPAVDANLKRSTITLIKSLAKIIAADRDLCGKIQVVYVPDAQVWATKLYAAADVTEQIATAAIEDIDLTEMQAMINGVISIGSLGKTNYWLQQFGGEGNCFRFGLAIPEIALFKEYGYDPVNYYKYYPQIRQAIDYLLAGYFSASEPSLGRAIVNTLLGADEQMVMADYIFYAACQAHVGETYDRASQWTQMSILNVAGVR